MIYFIQAKDGGLIKIGTTIRLSQRLKQLASEYGEELQVLAVTDGSYEEETQLHYQFAHLRKGGELFEPGDDLLGFIVHAARPWDGTDEAPLPDPRPRMYFDCDDRMRWALRLRAAKENMEISEYIKQVVAASITKELAEVDQRIAKGDPVSRPQSGRGRKPKSE